MSITQAPSAGIEVEIRAPNMTAQVRFTGPGEVSCRSSDGEVTVRSGAPTEAQVEAPASVADSTTGTPTERCPEVPIPPPAEVYTPAPPARRRPLQGVPARGVTPAAPLPRLGPQLARRTCSPTSCRIACAVTPDASAVAPPTSASGQPAEGAVRNRALGPWYSQLSIS